MFDKFVKQTNMNCISFGVTMDTIGSTGDEALKIAWVEGKKEQNKTLV